MNDFLQDITCPITKEIINYPVIAVDGFTYEEDCFKTWVASGNISPMTGIALSSTNIVQNKTMAYITNRYNYYVASATHYKLCNVNTKSCVNPLPESLKVKLAAIMLKYFRLAEPLSALYISIDALLEEHPNVPQLLIEYANMKRFGCEIEKAMELIEKAQSENPTFTIPKYMKARLISVKGNPLNGKNIVDEVQSSIPIIDHTLLETRYLSSALLNTKGKTDAFKLITAYSEVCPDDMRALLNQIYALYTMKDTERVLEYSKKFLEKYQYDACVVYYRAKAYAIKKDKVQAFKYYDLIIERSKEPMFLAQCYYDKAVLRQDEQELEPMKTELERANNLYPRINADIVLADMYRHKKEYKNAFKWLKIYGARVNATSDIYYNRLAALMNEEVGDKEAAIMCYTILIEKDGVNAYYYNTKIEALLNC